MSPAEGSFPGICAVNTPLPPIGSHIGPEAAAAAVIGRFNGKTR